MGLGEQTTRDAPNANCLFRKARQGTFPAPTPYQAFRASESHFSRQHARIRTRTRTRTRTPSRFLVSHGAATHSAAALDARTALGFRLPSPSPFFFFLAFADSYAQQNEEYALASCARQASSSAHDVSRPPLAPSPLPSHPTTATCPRTASASPRSNNHHHRARLHTARTPAAIRAAAAAVPTTTAGSPHQLHRLPPYLRSRLHLHSHSSAACSPTKSRHWFRGCGAFGSGPRSPKSSPESWGKRGKLTAMDGRECRALELRTPALIGNWHEPHTRSRTRTHTRRIVSHPRPRARSLGTPFPVSHPRPCPRPRPSPLGEAAAPSAHTNGQKKTNERRKGRAPRRIPLLAPLH
ncbi:hypothetical protein K438DRAFT_361909 [Mycena galopus ATCC 62051]|nr:hypothetical protein K438DRAFT_361909 [Mycena galopus ATCC 62051]